MSKFVENVEEVVLAVRDLDKTAALFEDLFGLEFKDSWEVPIDNMEVKCAFIGDTQFHIAASKEPDGVIGKHIRARGEGIHHIAFRVKNLDAIVATLKQKGLTLVPQEPRVGRNSRYIFVHPKCVHGLLIELMERLKSQE